MFFSLRNRLRKINNSIHNGQLSEACSHARESGISDSASGRRLTNKLVEQLICRANRYAIAGDLAAAWRDLADAASIASGRQADRVSRGKNQLVDQTIASATMLLNCGKYAQATTSIGILTKQNIQDRRADDIQRTCQMIHRAEKLARQGQLNAAATLLEQIQQFKPELTYLKSKIGNYRSQCGELASLTKQLQSAINLSAWDGARQVTHRMLQIAPKHKVAMDALKRCEFKTTDGGTQTMVKIDSNHADIYHIGPEVRESPVEIPFPASDNPRSADQSTHGNHSSTHVPPKPVDVAVTIPTKASGLKHGKAQNPMRSFMLWIDGVGGFLVCTEPDVTIGRAATQAKVDVPVQADLRSKHLTIRRGDGSFIVDPIGSVSISEGWEPGDLRKLDQPAVLKNQQLLDLGNGVTARFQKTHPLGNSARLEFTNRHRTEPWSDAVILMGEAILMGPDPNHHVFCPKWRQQMLVFRRDGEILLRIKGSSQTAVEVNGQRHEGDVMLQHGIHVMGEEFSISCEEVS